LNSHDAFGERQRQREGLLGHRHDAMRCRVSTTRRARQAGKIDIAVMVPNCTTAGARAAGAAASTTGSRR
jgi:hypothetical protein